MNKGTQTFFLSTAALVSLLVGCLLFWRAVEAPQRSVRAEDEFVPLETPAGPPLATPISVVAAVVVPTATTTLTPTTVSTVASQLLPAPGTTLTVRVPILMYHRIDKLPPNPDELRKSLSVSPADFDTQVHFLKDRGFTSLTLNDLYDGLQGKSKLPAKPVVFTFDDGYADNYANAFPVLKRYGFVGTFFVITDFMGTGDYMNWNQLKEMSAAGMKIGPHSRTHPDLTKQKPADLVNQVKGSKDAIQTQLGLTPTFFCYPSGRYNKDVIDVLRANGFLGAVTTNYGSDHSLPLVFELKRVRIDGRESFTSFARKLGENP